MSLEKYASGDRPGGFRRNRPPASDLLQILMRNIDFETTLRRLGISAKRCNSPDEYRGFCPDHGMFRGVPPSDPRWYVNSRSGLCYCQTEQRGSNLLEVARRLLGLETCREALEKLLDGRPVEVRFVPRPTERPKPAEPPDREKLRQALAEVRPFFDNGTISPACAAYFERDGIRYDTLRKFGIVSCECGKYRNRALIPFRDRNREPAGFVAVDYLGREEWAKQHARYRAAAGSADSFDMLYRFFLGKYRKALYAPGFASRRHLYGFYEEPELLKYPPSGLVLVEGERDVLKLMQEGIPCVGVHGACIKAEQRLLLKESGVLPRLKKLFLGFDMDEAGNAATQAAYEMFSREMDSDRIIVLNFPDGKDPKKFRRQELLAIMRNAGERHIHSR